MASISIPRLLKAPERSFFLFGPRGSGKSTWLRKTFRDCMYFDLLEASLCRELMGRPEHLEALAGNLPERAWVALDEIQKIPPLLDEVHRLMEKRRWRFALCGSSARKLRRGGVNLLGGRAITRTMEAFSWREIQDSFDLNRAIEWGSLPVVHNDPEEAPQILDAYVNTYIKEEIKEEGAVRNLPPFIRFLQIAGQINAQTVNILGIARDAEIPRSSAVAYFSILEDTLLGRFLPAYLPRVKIFEQTHPKFHWFDPGVARAAAGLLFDPADRLWKGAALETFLYHELRVYNETFEKHRPLFYYRTRDGHEVDFVIETRKSQSGEAAHAVCIEVKLSEKWDRKWESTMRILGEEPRRLKVDKMFGVYTGKRSYHFDGVDVLPVEDFLRRLYQGEIF